MRFIKKVFLFLIILSCYSMAEVIVAESNTFTFPPITPVYSKKIVKKTSYFKISSLNLRTGFVQFSWAIENSSTREDKKLGIITIYNLKGRVVKRIPLYKSNGTVTWKFNKYQDKNGMYLVSFRYNDFHSNVKLMLWK